MFNKEHKRRHQEGGHTDRTGQTKPILMKAAGWGKKDQLITGYFTSKNNQDMEITSNKNLHKSTYLMIFLCS